MVNEWRMCLERKSFDLDRYIIQNVLKVRLKFIFSQKNIAQKQLLMVARIIVTIVIFAQKTANIGHMKVDKILNYTS